MIILSRIHVSIPFQNCGLVTCKNETDFFGYCNEFEYNHVYVKLIKYS